MNLVERIRQIGIIPVVSIPEVKHALPLAEALLAGGLPCAEITFRTAAAAEAIGQIKKHLPELLVGAGTVLSVEQADMALGEGAEFIVSPGTNPLVVEHCLNQRAPIFPGVCTPTEIELALSKGVEILKFFPAEPAGGRQIFASCLCALPPRQFHPDRRNRYEKPGQLFGHSASRSLWWQLDGETGID